MNFLRYAILGNSGSGKTWLASRLATAHHLPVLDLDSIAWEPAPTPTRRSESEVTRQMDAFLRSNDDWIVEGCYGSFIEYTLSKQPTLIFLNPGLEICRRNCLARPHEPGKFSSKEQQDAMLSFLLQWVSDYYTRSDDMSLSSHRRIFDAYTGPKEERTRQL